MRLERFAAFGGGVLAVLVSTATPALATLAPPVAVPELDGTSLSAGLGLLAAGVLIVRSRIKSK